MANEDEYYEEEHEDDIYSEDMVEELRDDDEIKQREEAFMRGYDEDLNKTNPRKGDTRICSYCGYEIDIEEDICSVCGAGIDELAGEV